MDKLEIIPLKHPVDATVRIPGSKSYTNRALILAALAKGPVVLKNPLYSDDTEAMIGCLRALGLRIDAELDRIVVRDGVDCIEEKEYHLFARDSGTTVRFMLALLCIVPGVKTIGGSPRLNERPIRDLVDGLRELGAKIEYVEKEGQLPVKVSSSALTGHAVRVKGDVSSQFLTALLMIAPRIQKGLKIVLAGPLISKPYVDMTLSCMKDWGAKVDAKEGEYSIPHQNYRMDEYVIEGDFSSAGYFFAIAVLTGSKITLENLNPDSAQADRKFLDILAGMGNPVTMQERSIRIEGKRLIPIDVDMEDCPDQVMTMAVLAAFANGVTKITGVRSLRVKETERVVAIKNELGKMKIRTEDTHDTLTIHGGSPHAAEIDTYNDHRMAMAFAVAGMRLPGMVINRPEVVHKTFPTFWSCVEGWR